MGSIDAIEAISSSKKRINNPFDRYAHLLNDVNELTEETNKYIEENKNLDIETIILEVCSKDREIQFGRKVALVNIRALLQQAQNDQSNKKTGIFRDPTNLYLDTAAVICHITSVSFGPGFTAIGGAFEASSRYNNKVIDSSIARLDYNSQRMRDLVVDHSQQMQQADREHDQNASAIDRMIQNSRRMAETLVH